ncbi:hypothetical protein E1285_34040, partial [Actinomadura sp. 7K507]
MPSGRRKVNGTGTLRDRGEGPVSYLAAILLICAILAVIAVSGVAAAVTTGTEDAVCKVLRAGGLSGCGDQDAPPAARSPAPTPSTNEPPTPT